MKSKIRPEPHDGAKRTIAARQLPGADFSDRSTNISGAGSMQSISWEQRIQHSEEPIVLAERGRCKAFGDNKCRPMWDNRGKSCVCAGA